VTSLDGTRVFLAIREPSMVLVARLPDLSDVHHWPLPAERAHGIDIDHRAGLLYVACDSDALIEVDAANGAARCEWPLEGCTQHGRRGLAGHADAAVRRILRGAPCRSTAGRAVEPRLPQTNCMKAGGHSRPFCCLQRAGGGAEVDAVRLRQGRAESEAIASDAVARATRVEGEIEGPRAELAADQDQPESASPKPRRSRPG
jgi:hypothetical protein